MIHKFLLFFRVSTHKRGTLTNKTDDRREMRRNGEKLLLEWKQCILVLVEACGLSLPSLFLFLFLCPSWCLVFKLQRRCSQDSVPTTTVIQSSSRTLSPKQTLTLSFSFHSFYSLISITETGTSPAFKPSLWSTFKSGLVYTITDFKPKISLRQPF